MRRLLMMILAIVLLPLAARGQVVDSRGHYMFNVPDGWVMQSADTARQNGADYLLFRIGHLDDMPIIRISADIAGGFRDDPQAYIDEWKRDTQTPPEGTYTRHEAAYDPVTGHIVADIETSLDGKPYTHARAIFVSGKGSVMAIGFVDRSADFAADLPALNAIVNSLVMETNTPTPTYGAPVVNQAAGKPSVSNPPAYANAWLWWIIGGVAVLLVLGLGFLMLLVIGALVVRGMLRMRTPAAAANRPTPAVGRPGERPAPWAPNIQGA